MTDVTRRNFFGASALFTTVGTDILFPPSAGAQAQDQSPALPPLKVPESFPVYLKRDIEKMSEDPKELSYFYSLATHVLETENDNDRREAAAFFHDFLGRNKSRMSQEVLTEALIHTVDGEELFSGVPECMGDCVYATDPASLKAMAEGVFFRSGWVRFPDVSLQTEMASWLVDAGANIHYQESGYTFLHIVAIQGNKVLMQLFHDRGLDASITADVSDDLKPSLVDCLVVPFYLRIPSIKDMKERLDLIRMAGEWGSRPSSKVNPPSVVLAALRGDVELVKALRDIGASLDMKDTYGHTAADYLRQNGPAFPPNFVLDRLTPKGYGPEIDYWDSLDDQGKEHFKFLKLKEFRNSPEVKEILEILGNPSPSRAALPQSQSVAVLAAGQ